MYVWRLHGKALDENKTTHSVVVWVVRKDQKTAPNPNAALRAVYPGFSWKNIEGVSQNGRIPDYWKDGDDWLNALEASEEEADELVETSK